MSGIAARSTPSPQVAQAGSRRSVSSRSLVRERVVEQSRPATVGRPSTSLIASVACSTPITPGSTPSTPASAQLGDAPGGGGAGYRQR
jgi:hypothetical protein